MVGGIIAKKEVYLTMSARLKNVTKVGGRMNKELKPCPFCGGKAVIHVSDGVRVICTVCEAKTRTLVDGLSQGKPTLTATVGMLTRGYG